MHGMQKPCNLLSFYNRTDIHHDGSSSSNFGGTIEFDGTEETNEGSCYM